MKAILSKILIATFAVFATVNANAAGEPMKIKISSGGIVITAELTDNATSRDLYSKLPLNVNLIMHEDREVYADIELSKDAVMDNGYVPGDIAYYVPGNALVLYYAPGHTDGLIRMGRMSGWEQLAQINSSFSATIEQDTSVPETVDVMEQEIVNPVYDEVSEVIETIIEE